VGGSVLGIGEHGQKMTAVEGGISIVAHACVRGEEKWVGQIHATVILTDDIFPFTINCFKWLVVEDTIQLGIENELADEPSPFRGKGLEVLVIS